MSNSLKNEVESVSASSHATLHEIIGNAIRYWEPRRLIYNLVLGLIVIGYFIAHWPASKTEINFSSVLALFVLAVLANVCYCAAYIVDLFAQWSDVRPSWFKWRWVLFAVGTSFAAIITRGFAMGFVAGAID